MSHSHTPHTSHVSRATHAVVGSAAEVMNRDCACLSLDRQALAHALESELGRPGMFELVQQRNPHLFSALPVFVARMHIERMQAVAQALQRVTQAPGWRDAVLAQAPEAARRDPGNPGLFLGLDFHLEEHDSAPQLIEINTNPGGALLSAALARAQRACCDEMLSMVPSADSVGAFERDILDMFLQEWREAGRDGQPRRIAIVDEHAEQQYLYAEFVLFERLFARAGIDTVIASPEQLRCDGSTLWVAHGGAELPVDLVYNRLTDFGLEQAPHAALRQAWDSGCAVLAPHPRAHALYADKRNLGLLCDAAALRALGADPRDAELLAAHVPRTVRVDGTDADALWAQRRELFFKPWSGFGGRAAYRGAKLTRGVWAEIVRGGYVAQTLHPPGLRHTGGPEPLKFDVRAYAYAGRVQWFSARLYQGQTTNFRTPGGGFAPVYTAPNPD